MYSPSKLSANLSPGGKPPPGPHNNQGIATLIVMIAVLLIIVLFCCFAAPGIRGLCKRYIFRPCVIDDTDLDNASRVPEEASPTVILLPNGRMLVVDRRVMSEFRLDNSGIELMEISADLIGSRTQLGSTPSILDSSDTSKGISPTSLGIPPPTYEEVFPDFPPSYSEINLTTKNYETVNMNTFKTSIINEKNERRDRASENYSADNNMNREFYIQTDFSIRYNSSSNNNINSETDKEDHTNNNNV